MKKLLIVNNNMKVGGVQKSLYNLLWALEGRYDVSLLLFSPRGEYLDKLPPEVKLLPCKSLFRYLGLSQGECKRLPDRLKRGFLAFLSRFLGRPAAIKLLLLSQKRLPEEYDCAISYLHNGNIRSFYGGVQEFVLKKVKSKKKVAFLHCDYRGCGGKHPQNDRILREFDCIAPCSEGCSRAFCRALPELEKRCRTVRNCHRFDEIQALAEEKRVAYDKNKINLLVVARLAHEKGVERAIEALAYAKKEGHCALLHIVGNGAMAEELRALAKALGLEQDVIFYGEQANPYPYMKNADLLLISSYHEAAPLVIEEAACLGLPTLSVETTSSREMVLEEGRGWTCENSREALNAALCRLLEREAFIKEKKQELLGSRADNARALHQFETLVEG